MRNLLFANFSRLFQSRAFRGCLALMAAAAAGLVLLEYQESYTVSLDRVVFQSLSVYGLVAAVFVSLFLGAEYGDGTIRNKLITGSRRRDVYCSGYVAAAAGCVLLYLAAIVPAAALGIGLFEPEAGPGAFLTAAGLGLLTCFAYGSLYCLVSMLCHNKALTAVCCLGLALALLFLAVFVNLRLAQPEVSQVIQAAGSSEASESGLVVAEVPNPYYLTGVKRQVFELLQRLNPTGQAALLTTMDCERPGAMAADSLLLSAAVCAAGALAFRRKDIK